MKKMILLVVMVLFASHALAYDWYFDETGPIGKGPSDSGGVETSNIDTFGVVQDYMDDIYLYYSKNGVKTLFLKIKVLNFSHKDIPGEKQNISLIFEKANFFRGLEDHTRFMRFDQRENIGVQPFSEDAVRFDIKTDNFDYSIDDVLYITWKGNMQKINELFEKANSTPGNQPATQSDELEVFVRVAPSDNKKIKTATNTKEKLASELDKFVVTNITSQNNKFPLEKEKKTFFTGRVGNLNGTFLALILEKNNAYELRYGTTLYPYHITIDEEGKVHTLNIL